MKRKTNSIFDGLGKKGERRLFEAMTESQFPPQKVYDAQKRQKASDKQLCRGVDKKVAVG